MGREPMLYVVTGQKEIGKTTVTIQMIREYVAGNPAAGVRGRKALIFDAQNEYSDYTKYPDITALPLNKIGLYSMNTEIGIRRIPPFKPNGHEMTPDQKANAVLHILANFRNGLLLLEDINNYISDHLPSDVVGTILSQRHKGTDMVLHYHSLGRIQKKIWPHITVMRMHKTGDAVVDNKDKFPDKFECFKIAETIINNQFVKGNKRFYLHIQYNSQKIVAAISEVERMEAIDDYISLYSSRLVKPLTERRDAQGNKTHSYSEAFKQVRTRILTSYFD